MTLVQEAAVFIALAVALAGGAAWRWHRPEDRAASQGARAGLWLLAVCAASISLQLAGLV